MQWIFTAHIAAGGGDSPTVGRDRTLQERSVENDASEQGAAGSIGQIAQFDRQRFEQQRLADRHGPVQVVAVGRRGAAGADRRRNHREAHLNQSMFRAFRVA